MVDALTPNLDLLRKQVTDLMRENASLKGGGGSGTSDDMEPRVAVLEAHMETVRKDVSELKRDIGDVKLQLATLTERVAHLPSKSFIVTFSLMILAAIAAAAAFQQQMQHFVHG